MTESTSNQRPSTAPRRRKTRFFGQFLLSEGYITAPQLLAALEYQEQFNARLGEYAVALGLLTLFDARRIQALQVSKDLMFGEAAMELQLLNNDQLREVVAAQRNDHVLLGEALCKLGYVDESVIARAVSELGEAEQAEPDQWLSIPGDAPSRELLIKTCYLAHRLLPRVWDLPNKVVESQVVTQKLRLSDRNASITFQGQEGQPGLRVYLGATHAITERAVRVVTGNPTPSDADCDEAVRDLLTTICNNAIVTLASEGVTLVASDVASADFSVDLGDNVAVVVPFVTHEGQVFLAFTPA